MRCLRFDCKFQNFGGQGQIRDQGNGNAILGRSLADYASPLHPICALLFTQSKMLGSIWWHITLYFAAYGVSCHSNLRHSCKRSLYERNEIGPDPHSPCSLPNPERFPHSHLHSKGVQNCQENHAMAQVKKLARLKQKNSK